MASRSTLRKFLPSGPSKVDTPEFPKYLNSVVS